MASRLDLQNYLEFLAGPSGKVYYQPPENVNMRYPAVLYERDQNDVQYASNIPYRIDKRYQVTVIDRDPESEIVAKLEVMPKCTFVRAFKTSGLNHTIFNLFF